jgi:hypothetical protein
MVSTPKDKNTYTMIVIIYIHIALVLYPRIVPEKLGVNQKWYSRNK